MKASDLEYVSRECLKCGKYLARFQNVAGITMPRPKRPRFWWRWLHNLFWEEPDPGQFNMTPEALTQVVNALVSAGNLLETQAKQALAQTTTSNGVPAA